MHSISRLQASQIAVTWFLWHINFHYYIRSTYATALPVALYGHLASLYVCNQINVSAVLYKTVSFLLKSDLLKTIQISIQFFFNKKFKNGFYFFTCILPDYVAHDITKEFWKNIHFENMRAVFLWVVKTDFGEEKA